MSRRFMAGTSLPHEVALRVATRIAASRTVQLGRSALQLGGLPALPDPRPSTRALSADAQFRQPVLRRDLADPLTRDQLAQQVDGRHRQLRCERGLTHASDLGAEPYTAVPDEHPRWPARLDRARPPHNVIQSL